MLQRTAVLRTADNHGSRCNGTSNGPTAHAQSEKKRWKWWQYFWKHCLSVVPSRYSARFCPGGYLLPTLKIAGMSSSFNYSFLSLSATINPIMKVKGRPFLSLFLMWQHQKVSCIVWFAHIFVAREVDISYLSSRWFITSIQFAYNFSCSCNG